MPLTADKRYNNAAIEPDSPDDVSNERSSHHAENFPLGRYWRELSDDVEIF